jgi:hypothetical protein
MVIRIIKKTPCRLQFGVCIRCKEPYGERFIRSGHAVKITESEFAEYVAKVKIDWLRKRTECKDCPDNKPCKKCQEKKQ